MTEPTLDAYGRNLSEQEAAQEPLRFDERPRCWKCNKIVAHYATRPWMVNCAKCRATNKAIPRVPREIDG